MSTAKIAARSAWGITAYTYRGYHITRQGYAWRVIENHVDLAQRPLAVRGTLRLAKIEIDAIERSRGQVKP